MEKIYCNLDIQQFLYSHGILITQFVKQNSSFKKLAIAKFIGKAGEYEIHLQISYSNFKIFIEDCTICYQDTSYSYKELKNLSADWIQYLLNKYPNSSALIKESINLQKALILAQCQKEIEPLKKQIDNIKSKAKKELDYFNKLEKELKKQEKTALA